MKQSFLVCGMILSVFTTVAKGANGTGLKGEYFNGRNLDAYVTTQIDAFGGYLNWGGGSPASGVGADNCSARWTGEIEAPSTGVYSFRTDSDDGARLWINGQLQIDSWCECVGNIDVDGTGSAIFLEAGRRYPIRLEWFEAGGNALIALFWIRPDVGSVQYVPTTNLYPCISPSIVLQPSNITVRVRGTATFGVAVSDSDPVNYQWQFQGTNIVGATNSTLVLSNVNRRQAGVYRVLVSKSEGCSVLSNEAILRVRPRLRAQVVEEPEFGVLFSFESEEGDIVFVDSSDDLETWTPFMSLTNGISPPCRHSTNLRSS